MTDILILYTIIAVINLFYLSVALIEGNEPEEVDDFWDAVIYSVFWIVQPMKALVKFIKNLFK